MSAQQPPNAPPPYRHNEPTGCLGADQPGQLVPPGQDEATGELVLVLTPQPGSKFRFTVTPVVMINGWSVPAHWDTNVLRAPVGRHRIQVGLRYLWQYAPAEYDVDVEVGRQTVVHYTGPYTIFAKGSLGPTPQPPRGGWIWAVFVAAIFGVPLLVAIVFLVIAAIAS